jgi:hypothetical protein
VLCDRLNDDAAQALLPFLPTAFSEEFLLCREAKESPETSNCNTDEIAAVRQFTDLIDNDLSNHNTLCTVFHQLHKDCAKESPVEVENPPSESLKQVPNPESTTAPVSSAATSDDVAERPAVAT